MTFTGVVVCIIIYLYTAHTLSYNLFCDLSLNGGLDLVVGRVVVIRFHD